MHTNSKSVFKKISLSVSAVAGLAIFAVSTTAVSAASTPPAKILCTVSKVDRAGIEDLPPAQYEAHLFEYIGKLTIKQEGNKFSYSYGEGKDTYKVKYKASYSKHFAEKSLGVFQSKVYEWLDPSGYLVLVNDLFEAKFHIDMKSLRYYGYDSDFGYINTYSGSCTILNK
ncbi:hypothetical protein [Methylophilus sp. QUAN]|uniref:hypothetical protein n=1 Tax=Methylophilus sp. QUAN TaxID=2781020 RepID=UPI00188F8A83|nr:hypothetical protein [Methylophilus sp. QUAN]MBF4990157.1 hypothetical protein [Methylophilus sp. QUAN]